MSKMETVNKIGMAEQGTLTNLSVDQLHPSPWNRAADGNGEFKELVESVKLHGILQPLIVRRLGDGQFEIVAGHRRWAAAKKAGLSPSVVPCIITELSDTDAKVAQLVENLHRKNLNPMEEARAFQQLREGNAHTPQTIADMAGKNVKYVYRALELLKLPKKAQEALESGLLSGAHGHQLVRVGDKQMDAVVKYATSKAYNGQVPSVEDLKKFISQRMSKDLSRAPWDKSKEFAGKQACAGCPYNSGNQDMLFDEAKGGQCTNGSCYTIKMNAFYKQLREAGQKRYPHLKFIGIASATYGNNQTINGYEIVPDVAQYAQKWKGMEGFIEGFGFGILKPSNWSSLKTPKLVVLKKLSEKKAQEQRSGSYSIEDQAFNDFKHEFVKIEEAKVLWNSLELQKPTLKTLILSQLDGEWEIKRCAGVLMAAGLSIDKPLDEQLETWQNAGSLLLLWTVLQVHDHGSSLEALVKGKHIDFKSHHKEWSRRLMEEWKKDKDAIIEAYKKERVQ